MADPHRAEIAPRRAVVELAEEASPPRSLRVRGWSDGTMRMGIGSARPSYDRLGWWLLAVLFTADISTVIVDGDGLGYDAPTLRWIAQRLQRAIEAAR